MCMLSAAFTMQYVPHCVFLVRSGKTRPDIFRFCPVSRKTTITDSPASRTRCSSSPVDTPGNGWRGLEPHPRLLEVQPCRASDNEADGRKICGISRDSPIVTWDSQTGMHFRGINGLMGWDWCPLVADTGQHYSKWSYVSPYMRAVGTIWLRYYCFWSGHYLRRRVVPRFCTLRMYSSLCMYCQPITNALILPATPQWSSIRWCKRKSPPSDV